MLQQKPPFIKPLCNIVKWCADVGLRCARRLLEQLYNTVLVHFDVLAGRSLCVSLPCMAVKQPRQKLLFVDSAQGWLLIILRFNHLKKGIRNKMGWTPSKIDSSRCETPFMQYLWDPSGKSIRKKGLYLISTHVAAATASPPLPASSHGEDFFPIEKRLLLRLW